MVVLQFVVVYVVVQLNFIGTFAEPTDHNADRLLGKDETGNWWPVTIIWEHDDGTVACIVDDDDGTEWDVVYRANLRWEQAAPNQIVPSEIDNQIYKDDLLISQAHEQSLAEWWRYTPCNGKPGSIREDASFRSKRTTHVLQPGEAFKVDATHVDADGITQLRLADGRGWFFTQILGGCEICFPITNEQGQDDTALFEAHDQHFAEWWRYDPCNGKPGSIREDASFGAKRTTNVLQPGEVFNVDAHVDADGITYLRLADGRGWFFTKILGGCEICFPMTNDQGQDDTVLLQARDQPLAEWWRYNPCNGKPGSNREDASFTAKRTTNVLQPGETFEVDAHVDADGITHLRLADGRGWFFTQIPGGCSVSFPVDDPQPEWWRYTPFNGKAMAVRERPDMAAKRTDTILQPGDVFQVDASHLDEEGIMYLRLADRSGWLFDKAPDGLLCSLA